MATMALPKRLRTIKQVVNDYEGALTDNTLRNEIAAGNLRCIRPRESCRAPILLTDEDLAAWMDKASKRTRVLSPKETKQANDAA